jgi:cyclophilin family peptidyl-prolyl cis-trans isomerase/HEAT repeat protein
LGVVLVSCVPKNVATPVATPAAAPPVSWNETIAWIVRLEDQRIIRDPSAPAAEASGAASPAKPAPPSDLIRLLESRQPAVRERAALALGRVGLPEAVEPLSRRLADERAEVRQMAAFALGLIGDTGARPALLKALGDGSPIVQGRAAEALGLIGDKADAAPVGEMLQGHVKAGALDGLDPDDLSYPLAPAVEASRLALYALTRLGSFEGLQSSILDAAGKPVSRWWPVAYSLQRINDERAASALAALLETPGRYTAAFAAKGLGRSPSPQTLAALRRIVNERHAHPMVVVQSMRTLATAGDAAALPLLMKMVVDRATDVTLRLEAMSAFGSLVGPPQVELLLDLLSHPEPAIRAIAVRTLARVDAEAFLSSLASLDADEHWTVRVAQAQALGTVQAERGGIRLLSMLADRDARVIPAVLAALVASKAPAAERLAVERLKAEDFAVRAAAAAALADLKAVSQVPPLVDALKAAAGENTYVARAAILGALHRLDRKTARPLLEEALQDRDWAVRVRALTLLREQGLATAPLAGTIRPAAAGRAVDDPEWRRVVVPPYAPRVFIETSKGEIELELAVVDAPLTSENFVSLARKGFFDNAPIHRVVPDFVMQDGDPRGDGEGGPGYTIRDEINQRPYLRGTVGMALDWQDTGGSQFFITHSPQPHLDGRYTVFGRVVNGMDVVDRIVASDVIRRVRVWDGVTPQQ